MTGRNWRRAQMRVVLVIAIVVVGGLAGGSVMSEAAAATNTSKPTTRSYVALGDSFSSGEGLESTAPGYIYPSGKYGCHRSTGAYPELVAHHLGENLTTFNTWPTNRFVACSGATTKGVLLGSKTEPSQLGPLTTKTKYVTITAGGDNLGFSGVIKACLNATIQLGGATYTQSALPTISSPAQCSKDLQNAAEQLMPGPPPDLSQCDKDPQTAAEQLMLGPSGVSSLPSLLKCLYTQILKRAPSADVMVLNYPQVFTTTPLKRFCPVTGGIHLRTSDPLLTLSANLSLTPSNVSKFNVLEVELNQAIAGTVTSLEAAGKNIHLVDVNSGTKSLAFPCSTETNGASDINGVRFAPGSSITDISHNCRIGASRQITCANGGLGLILRNLVATESFHPKASAHAYMATQVESAIRSS
jgi:hypothetical protein